MSGLEALGVIAAVAACISAYADARKLYDEWKVKQVVKKGQKNTLKRFARRARPEYDLGDALVLYSEYVAGYFNMVHRHEGPRWLRGDKECMEILMAQLTHFREEVLIVLQEVEAENGVTVTIDEKRLISVTMGVSFEYMVALDGQFQRMSDEYFVHQSIHDVRSVGVQFERLGTLPVHPSVEYQWVIVSNDGEASSQPASRPMSLGPANHHSGGLTAWRRLSRRSGPVPGVGSDMQECRTQSPENETRSAAEDSYSNSGHQEHSQGLTSRAASNVQKAARSVRTSFGRAPGIGGSSRQPPLPTADLSEYCPFAVQLLQNPNMMKDSWVYDQSSKKIKYQSGGLPENCPSCPGLLVLDEAFSSHYFEARQRDLGFTRGLNTTPRFFAKYHVPARHNTYVCIWCLSKGDTLEHFNKSGFFNHMRKCKNWQSYSGSRPDSDIYKSPRHIGFAKAKMYNEH